MSHSVLAKSRRRITIADGCVLMAMVLVATAIGTGLVLHGGLAAPISATLAIVCWLAMASAHVLVRRERLVTHIGRELQRLEGEVAHLKPEKRRPERANAALEMSFDATLSSVMASAKHQSDAAPEIAERAKPDLAPATSQDHDTTEAGVPMPPQAEAKTKPDAALRAADGPETPRSSGIDPSEALGALIPGREPERPSSAIRTPGDRQLRATHIDKVIKRLADDITAGQRARGSDRPMDVAEPKGEMAARRKPAADGPANAPTAPSLPSVASKQGDEDARRLEAALPGAAGAKVAAIADALMNENIDVYLEPIHGLDDHRARHYEVFARLRMEDGSNIGPDDYIDAVRGTGLLPLIDAVKVSQTKRVALQLINRGRSGSFFSQVTGESLSTPQFGEDVGTITGGDAAVASRLVLSFSQDDVRAFSPAQWASLASLKAMGFRFALEGVTDVDMDFERLPGDGFVFAKLDADVFVSGLPSPDGVIPAADICQFLASVGLTLIVQSIKTERQLGEVLGFGAVFGQGVLFGGPRPVKPHVLRGGDASARPPVTTAAADR